MAAIRVVRVTTDSPADAAGLLPGDRIVAIDGTPVNSLEVFYQTAVARGRRRAMRDVELYCDMRASAMCAPQTACARFHRALLI